ncbi:aspartate aminotransferase family protein [Rubrimonas cliftonensis]|uniref:Acetylornithine aminotransferase n=1 Tax=Rubrimonas cliftonensis TaxID=89524 RepID=A0A1H4BV08_9RHOB|nr:aspartate aminotransferase family protein [Rubrimonas cliftonensis]SEA51662.1 acetylornithine/N-succinyldiaminopimelate aminotransferase [Rubrimonas cliftonensis]
MIDAVLPTYARQPIEVARGEGCWLEATDGRRYLDFGAGIAVNSLGHAHPHLVKALTEQAGKVWHTSNLYRIPGQERLAERLVEATFADTVFFTNSGAEAMECAIKMARKFQSFAGNPERDRIVTFTGSFHGRTLATISAAGNAKYTDGFGPLLPGFDHVAFGDHDALTAAVTNETAAVILEPVQGEGGVRPVPPQCLRGLRELCDARGALLIFDEVQCGYGRTGRLFAHEWAGIAPDIMAAAKGIGGGFPLGACLATEAAASGMTAGSHGSTYGGNPLAMAVGEAVLDVMLAEGFLPRVSEAAGRLRQRLEGVVSAYPDVIEGVRGEGLLLGLKCAAPNVAVIAAARDAGLLLVGAAENVARVLPPLIVSDAEIDEGAARLEAACEAVRRAAAA